MKVEARDVIYIVCNPKSGSPAAVFATEEAAFADVAAVNDKRYVTSWVVRGGLVLPLPAGANGGTAE